jgi:hypothetical protein
MTGFRQPGVLQEVATEEFLAALAIFCLIFSIRVYP